MTSFSDILGIRKAGGLILCKSAHVHVASETKDENEIFVRSKAFQLRDLPVDADNASNPIVALSFLNLLSTDDFGGSSGLSPPNSISSSTETKSVG